MAHIHKKIRHHLTKHRAKLTTFASLLFVAIFLSGAFFLTRGIDPSVSELAFTEYSSIGVGSVVPASCESWPYLVANGDGNYSNCEAVTCWDGTVIIPAAGQTTCPATSACPPGYTGTYPDCVAPPCPPGYTGVHPYCYLIPSCPAGYSGTYPDCVAPVGCTTTTYDYEELQSDGCTVKSWSSDNVVCSNNSSIWLQGPYSYDSSSCAAPTCADPTATNYGGALPCTYPTPPSTCTDPNANNYGATGSCTYDPVLTARLSQSENETAPGETWTLTWSSVIAYSCTVTYTGPDGGGTIITPGTTTASRNASKSGTREMTLTPLGSYIFKNVCTNSSGSQSDTKNMTHKVVLPDLTAGPVTPTSVMVNTNNTFSSTISNIGTGDTGVSFKNLLQLATGPNGTGTVTDIASTTMSHLDNTRSSREDFTYRFTTAGTYYMRVCADKSSMSDTGVIDEGTTGGENNNCSGSWTMVTVTNGECALPWGGTIPDGSSTIAYNTPSVTSPDVCTSHDQTRHCNHSVLSGSYLNQSCGVGVPVASGFNISPKTTERGGLVKINWSIQNPSASCSITAVVQKPAVCDSTCTANRNASQTSINTALSSGTTNANDPNGGNRNMTTAITTAVSGGYAKGEKSLTLDYSTAFTLTCGTTPSTVRNLIYVTERTEG